MKRLFFIGIGAFVVISFCYGQAFSHVPYLEETDFSEEQPFRVAGSIEQSIAVYAWLEFENGFSDDVDVYTFNLPEPSRVFVQSLVPECSGYENFLPWFAVVGPGLPEPEYDSLPFALPQGQGAIVVKNLEPGQERTSFYEPFGGKSYYEGPKFDQMLKEPGTYSVYFWDPYQQGGDYVAVLGYEEIWRFQDIMRAVRYTPQIRQDKELHIECK
ncbi:MAG: hypothetical protein AB1611_00915 [bacterium]